MALMLAVNQLHLLTSFFFVCVFAFSSGISRKKGGNPGWFRQKLEPVQNDSSLTRKIVISSPYQRPLLK